MAKKVIGFSEQSDFDRMAASVVKSERTPMVGQRQRALPPRGSAPAIKRGVISQLGDYDVHLVTLLSGEFTQDLTTDGLTHTATEIQAYVAAEFDYNLRVGDVVIIAKIGKNYWIIETKNNCEGYCIHEDFAGDGYIYGWSFQAPNLPCCPEAGGIHILTTSDGVSYESATFQCNSDGTDRKWIYNTTKKNLRISPMLDFGNLEYRTDSTPAACTVRLQQYEQQLFASRADCGTLPKSVCLNPMCGVGSCNGCEGLSPMAYKVTIGSGARANPARPTAPDWCSECEGEWIFERMVTGNGGNYCNWVIKEDVGANSGGHEPTLVVSASEFSISCVDGAIWSSSGPVDCMNKQEIPFLQYYNPVIDPPYCIDYPATVTVEPYGQEVLEGNCYPLSVAYLSGTTFTSSTPLADFVCLQVPHYYEFEVSGVTDNTCDSCSEFNSVLRARLQGGSPSLIDWDAPSINPTCTAMSSTYTWRIDHYLSGGTGYIQLVLKVSGNTDRVVYTGPTITDYNCLGPNVFTYASDTGECSTWPATITVYPLIS